MVLLTGGLGGARLAPALRDALAGTGHLTVIANVGDDVSMFGLRVCPDLDSVLYALAGEWNASQGWGRADETLAVDAELGRLGSPTWFTLGDRDLAVHLFRAQALARGASLTEATAALSAALGIGAVTVLPAADEPRETLVALADGRVVGFQEWYVRDRAAEPVRAVHLAGGAAAPAAIEALGRASVVILGPSNPVASIGAILALDGVRERVRSASRRVAVSPVVASRPTRDAGVLHHAHARRALLRAVGQDDEPAAIAGLYRELVDTFVLDDADASAGERIRVLGLDVLSADVLEPRALARTLVGTVG